MAPGEKTKESSCQDAAISSAVALGVTGASTVIDGTSDVRKIRACSLPQ